MKRILTFLIILHSSLCTLHLTAQNPCHFNGYRCDTIAYNSIFISGDTLSGMPDNSFSPVVPIGFTFRFYDVDYNSLVISNNCFLSFNITLADSSSPWYISGPIPSSNNPTNAIYCPWQDIYNVSEGTIHYQTLGTSPNRKFVVSYDSIPMLICSAEYFTGQIVLYETTNVIEIQIDSKLLCSSWNSGFAIEGLQNENATMWIAAPGRNCPNQWTAYHDGRRFTPLNGPFPAPSLCMVSVDTSANKNIIIWNQPTGIIIDSFLIYREVNNSGNYSLIATQPQTAFSTYEDANSYPLQSSNRYKLAFMDSCGVISYQSNSYKTIHLTLSPGTGTSWNLNWDAYEGFSFADYEIYRGTSPSSMTLLTSVASTILSYNDATPPAGNLYYMIEINGAGGCNPSLRTSSFNYNVSMSNYASTNTIGIPVVIDNRMISINPNPSSGEVFIINNSFSQKGMITVTDVLGNEFLNLPSMLLLHGTNQLNLSSLQKGIYFINIKNESSSLMKRISIVK